MRPAPSKKPRPTHRLLSFTAYLNKVFHFRDYLPGLSDARHQPDISPQAVFQALFYGFVFRLRSLQQLEAELAEPNLQRQIGAERAFGDDVLRYSLCGFALAPIEQMLVDINRRLKRNKAFEPGRMQGRIVAALDGIEVLASYSRCCDSCLQRRVVSKDSQGQPVEQTQYYHRAVACQIVSSPVKAVLAMEWVQPGEGEDTTALRLLRALPERYGSPFFDILLLDSLYAQAPVLKLAAQFGWDLIISLKQEARELYQSAMGLFRSRPPDHGFSEQEGGKTAEVRLWETDGLPFTADYPQPVRVVWSQETVTENHYRRRQLERHSSEHEWLWLTTLDSRVFSARQVRWLGHRRWKQENNGWMDLSQHWALKHDYLHACKHRPKVESPAGERQPVANRGLAAVTLILCLAFVLCSAYVLLHSKIFRLYELSYLEVARQLYRSLWKGPPRIRAPDSRAPRG
jgi:hypothetical protein